MSVRIISIKTLKPIYPRVALINYTSELSENAKVFDGFIKSNSYWQISTDDIHHKSTIISISEWENFKSWNNWKNSLVRESIYKKNHEIIYKENFSLLKDRLPTDDIFTL